MSAYITNKGCDKCHKIDVGLVKISCGKMKNHFCYDCMTNFTLDLLDYAAHNLHNEFNQRGYDISMDNDGGYAIKRKMEVNDND